LTIVISTCFVTLTDADGCAGGASVTFPASAAMVVAAAAAVTLAAVSVVIVLHG